MYFNSLDFPVFLALTWLVWRLVHVWRLPRLLWLLLASAFFYGCWQPWYLLLVGLSIGLQYVAGLGISRSETQGARRAWMWFGVGGDLALLGVFKYGNFFLGSIEGAAKLAGLALDLPRIEAELPVGISFYTFQGLSYTLDLYWRRIPPARSLLDFAVYVLFFPQLVAGPIVRAAEFLPQLDQPPRTDPRAIGAGMFLILCGLTKKMVIADTISAWWVAPFFAHPAGHNTWEVLSTIWAANFQVYCDFSGYSDVAVGAAMLFGYSLPQNFNRPFWSQTPMEHWRRWHISLSTWLKDYLYVPLGGSRHGAARTDLNLVITFFLGGIWHGAGWTFVVWGFYNGVLLVLWRRFGPREATTRIGKVLSAFVTFNSICLGLIFLHAHSFADAWATFAGLFRPFQAFGDAIKGPGLVAFGAAVLLHLTPQSWKRLLEQTFSLAPMWAVALVVVMVGAVLSVFASMAAPFFYFQF